MDSNLIIRNALGNIASLGHLYDARSDRFCGLSIFKRNIPANALTVTDSNFSDIQLIHSDDFSEKFHKLDVKAELQVSVLAGLFTLQGSAHYLQDQKKSARTVKSSLLYNIKTKDENLNIYHEDLRESFAFDAIESGVATHVVIGISWGVNCVLSCQYENRDNRDVREIEGCLSAQLKKLSLSISGKASVDLNDGDNSKGTKFDIRVYGDILPGNEDLPTTMEEALHLMKQLPSLAAQCNDGKGKPLSYMLIPIKLLQSYLSFSIKADMTLKTLGEESVLRVVKLFEQMTNSKQKLHDFHQDILDYQYCTTEEDLEEILKFKEDMAIAETTLRSKLANTLVQVRSGKCEMHEIEDFICQFQKSEFSPSKTSLKLSQYRDLNEKIKFAKNLVSLGAKYIGYGVNLDDELLEDYENKIVVLYFTKDSKKDSAVWVGNRKIFLQELKSQKENCKWYVVDCDIHPALLPDNCSSVIQVIENGGLIIEDLRLKEEKTSMTPKAQPISSSSCEKILVRPHNLKRFCIQCPGIDCGDIKHHWICTSCGNPFQLNFGMHVYCSCGTTPVVLLEYKCPNRNHVAFIAYYKISLDEQILKLDMLQEMGIQELLKEGVKYVGLNDKADEDSLKESIILCVRMCSKSSDPDVWDRNLALFKKETNRSRSTGIRNFYVVNCDIHSDFIGEERSSFVRYNVRAYNEALKQIQKMSEPLAGTLAFFQIGMFILENDLNPDPINPNDCQQLQAGLEDAQDIITDFHTFRKMYSSFIKEDEIEQCFNDAVIKAQREVHEKQDQGQEVPIDLKHCLMGLEMAKEKYSDLIKRKDTKLPTPKEIENRKNDLKRFEDIIENLKFQEI